ncbi:MAG: glycosyltransferase [Bacteroidota bacterium]
MNGLGLFTSKIHHHASFSGYEQLIEYVEAEYVNALLRTFDQNLLQRGFIKLLRQTMTVSNWYHWQDFKAELAIRRYIIDSVSSQPLIHLLYGDSMLGWIPTMKAKYSFTLMATIHACPMDMPEIFRRPQRLQAVDHFVILAPNQLEPLVELGVKEENISLVPHGIDMKNIDAVHQERASHNRAPKQNGSQRLKVLGVGNWRRDFAMYNRIFEQLVHADWVEFTMVVPDFRRSQIRDQENVTLLTDISDQHLAQLYDESDVLLMAVEDAAANNVILEALAHGLPIVANRHAALKWYGNSGVIEFDDAGFAVRQLTRLHEDIRYGEELSEHAYRRAEQLTWDKVAKQMNDIYLSLSSNT